MKTRLNRQSTIVGGMILMLVIGIVIRAVAQSAPAPGVTISALGSNQFSIVITNGVLTNYELYWTPVLGNPDYPWQLIALNTNGATNFQFNGEELSAGFFEATVEQTFNGVPDYELADPNNPSLGVLSVTITSPTNGAVIQ
ncbi:MAG: hypothetical protein ACLQU4_07920 [Limisphaerales bacterium]